MFMKCMCYKMNVLCNIEIGNWTWCIYSGSMEPAFFRGDLLFLTNYREEPIRVGEIVVFKIEGRDIPIVHRVLKVHEKSVVFHASLVITKTAWCADFICYELTIIHEETYSHNL